MLRDGAELAAAHAVHPLGDEVETVRLKALPAKLRYLAEGTLRQHAACSCDEEVQQQALEAAVLLLVVAGGLAHHRPEDGVEAVGGEALVRLVRLALIAVLEDGAQDVAGVRALALREDGHHGEHHLRGRVAPRHHDGELLAAYGRVEELAVFLEELPVLHLVRHLHLAHPHRDEVGAERVAHELQVEQPVVLLPLVGEGDVDEVVAREVIVREQLLREESIAARQHEYLGVLELDPRDFLAELPLGVLPEDDAPLVILPQGKVKAPVELLYDIF